MTVTNQNRELPSDVKREYEDDGELESTFYVEKATHCIYEVKLFEDFALVRLAMPDYQPPVQRIDLMTLADLFEDYCGDQKELRGLLFGGTYSPIVISSKDNDGNG